jgi:hypothetical protein
MSGKVIDLARARQKRAQIRLEPEQWPIDRGSYRLAAGTDGQVYIDIELGDKTRVMQTMSSVELDAFIRDLLAVKRVQEDVLRDFRGANLWIAYPHPTNAGWLLVKHNDVMTPFKPVVCGAQRKKPRPMNPECKIYGGHENGPRDTRPKCAACNKPFAVGEKAYQAMAAVFGVFNGRPRICQGCCMPHREGIEEVKQ